MRHKIGRYASARLHLAAPGLAALRRAGGRDRLAAQGRAPRAGPTHRQGARARLAGRGQRRRGNLGRRGARHGIDRGRKARPRRGPLVGCPAPWVAGAGEGAARARRRGPARHDAGRGGAACGTPHQGASVRMAGRALSDRPIRSREDPHRRLADRHQADADRERPHRPGEGPRRGAARALRAAPHGRVPALVCRFGQGRDRRAAARGDRASLVRDHPPVRRRQRPRRPRHRGSGARAGVRRLRPAVPDVVAPVGEPRGVLPGTGARAAGYARRNPVGSLVHRRVPRRLSRIRGDHRPLARQGALLGSPGARIPVRSPAKGRQRAADAGPGGFEGGLSAGKYQNLTSTSRQTASRDLADLVEKGVLRATGQLKSTRYHVAVPEWQ